MVNDAERFSQEDEGDPSKTGSLVFKEEQIKRAYSWGTDTFFAPGIEFSIRTPFDSIPDPDLADVDSLRRASCPASFLELTIENTSDERWDGFFALQGDSPWTPLSQRGELKGMITRDSMGFATSDPSVSEFIDFGIDQALGKTHKTPNFLLGPIGGISFSIEAGSTKTVKFVVGYYKKGAVTFNRETEYWYTSISNQSSQCLPMP